MKKWTKELVIDGIEFKLTFWKDNWGLLWTRIEEKVLVRGWFGKVREDYALICEYWTDDNPIEVSCQKIAEYLTNEKKEKEFEKALDKFCS